MKLKKVLVHGTAESLKEFFSEKLTAKKYNCLATLTDDNKKNIPHFVYKLVDAVVLTNKPTRNFDIDYFRNCGVESVKIICWNPNGYIEHFIEKQDDGSEIYYMDGLSFHIHNAEEDRNFINIRYKLYLQNQFYALDEKDYPAKMAEIYQERFHKPFDWNNLQTWTEKMQWIKLYDSTPIKTLLADKFLVRQWIAEKIGTDYLIPLFGVWDNFEDIDFDLLPNQFVLKCNHGCSMNIICRDKKDFDIENAREKINAWLNLDWGARFDFQIYYNNIKKKIIAERFMTDGENFDLIDYKFGCFDGKPIYCQYLSNRSVNLELDYFDLNWNHMNFERADHFRTKYPEKIHKPKNFELMKELAAELCKDFSFVRVDFYEVEGKVYFGEMTFTPAKGNIIFNTKDTDEHFGSLMTLPIEKR